MLTEPRNLCRNFRQVVATRCSELSVTCSFSTANWFLFSFLFDIQGGPKKLQTRAVVLSKLNRFLVCSFWSTPYN